MFQNACWRGITRKCWRQVCAYRRFRDSPGLCHVRFGPDFRFYAGKLHERIRDDRGRDGPDFAKFRNRDYYIFGWPVLIGGICDRNLAALEVQLRSCHRCKQTRQHSARHTSEYSMHRPPRVKPNALAAALSAHPHPPSTEQNVPMVGRGESGREHRYGIALRVRRREIIPDAIACPGIFCPMTLVNPNGRLCLASME